MGNVVLDREGNLVLIDLDSFCAGPREWDLVQTAPFHERFGWRTDEEHREFVDAYGFDIMTWSGYPVFADHREIAMTLWLCGNPGATTGQLPKSASGWSRSGRGAAAGIGALSSTPAPDIELNTNAGNLVLLRRGGDWFEGNSTGGERRVNRAGPASV